MSHCPKCGREVSEGDRFCPYCGVSLAPEVNEILRHKQRYTREREVCFGAREREKDHLGLVSFGMFLLIVGFVFLSNPHIIDDVLLWFDQLIRNQVLTRPPKRLITSAVLFFGLIGLSNFLTAGIRLMIGENRRRILADTLSGVGLVSFAYLINLYVGYVLTWRMVLAIEAVVCGLLVILYGVVRSRLIISELQRV